MQAYLLDNSKVEIDPMSAEIGGSWQAPRRDGIPDVWGADELRFFYKRTLERRRPVVIDVGANTGSYSLLAAINRDMASYAFEPAPITYAVLNKNISLNNLEARVKAFNMALADRNGKGVLKYPESGKESGLACIGRPLRFDRWIEYEVDLWRLDDFAAQNGIEKADLIKLDTEGSELLVLKGAEEFVRRCRPNIFCEYHEVNAGQFGYHPRQIVELLHSWGYRHARVGHEDVYFYIPKGTGIVMPGFKKGDACDRPAVDHSVPAVCAERGRHLPKVAVVKQVLDVFGPWASVRWKDTTALRLFDIWPNKASMWEMTCLLKADWYVIPQRIDLDYTKDAVYKHTGREQVIRKHVSDVATAEDIPFHEYDLVITADPILDVPKHSDVVFAYYMNEHWDSLYARSLERPVGNYDLFFAHMTDLNVVLNELPQAVSFPFPRDPDTVRAVFGEKKQNSVWADWRTLTALAGTDLWGEQAKAAAADLEHALGMPVAYRQFCGASYGFTDPPAWGDAAHYLRAMAKCRYYVGVGRGSGPGQGLCDAASLGCICLGERNKPFHRMICHPCCLCDSKDDIPLMLKRIAASVELQEEILVWQDKMLREHFVEKPLAVLNRAVEIKAGKTPRRWSKQQNITLFSIPKAFRGDDAVRQRNAIKSWMLLEPQPEIILCGDDEGVAEVASEFGLSHLPDVRRNGYGTPLVSDLFEKAQVSASHDVLVYVNADIILLNDFMPAVHRCGEYFDEFLMVGRRWDADVSEPIDFDTGDWQDRLRLFIHTESFLHAPTGIDYFVFTRYLWPMIPDFGLGRTVWDNWLVGKPIGDGKPVVDATDAVTAIHQNHKFVPFGRRREEETVNLTLAGGSDSLRFTTHAAWKVTPYGVVARHVGEILEDNDFGAALMCMAGVFQQAPETVRRQYESYVSYTRPERLKRIADAAKSLLSLNAKNGNLRRLLSQLHQIDRAKLITATRPDSRANTATEALFDKGVNNLSPGNDRQVSGAFDRASQTRAQIPHVDGARTAACVGHGAASLAAEVCGAAFAGQYERGGAGRPPRQIHSGVAEPEQSPDLQVEAGYICSPAERAEREAHSEYGPLGLLPSRCWPASSSLQSARRTTEQDSSGKNTGGKCRQMLETLPSEKARLVDVEPRDVMAAKQTLKSYYCSRLGNVWQSAGAPVWFDHEIDYHLWPKNLFWIERGVFGRLVMSPGCKVLDLCCGDGYFSDIWFSTIAGHIDACDNDEDALRFAAQRHLNAKVAYHRVNILTQPLPSTDYDVVAWFEGIEHFSEQQIGQVLEKIRSSLASGGRLVGSTPLVTRQGRCGNRQHDREFDSQGDLEGVLKIVFGDVRTWATVYPGRTTCYFHASE